MPLKSLIRTIPDYPKPGIQFRDITTLLRDPVGFQQLINNLSHPFTGRNIDTVEGIEARGFIIGSAVAHQLSVGFIPVRKRGKLPSETIGQDYELEYGNDRVEIHRDAISPGEKVLLIDDLLATGGTAIATLNLLRRTGADIVACGFAINLPGLGGLRRLEKEGVPVLTLIEFEDS
tara:strand:- start:68932 stop:69459 length:528 start_codon:yes stop_codon:yes gene_type:complete